MLPLVFVSASPVMQGGRPCAALHYDGMDAERVHFARFEALDRPPVSVSVPRAAWERHREKLRGASDRPGVLPATPWVPWTLETALAAYDSLAAGAS